jgi:GNAT superfamily N-acetyltransferase
VRAVAPAPIIVTSAEAGYVTELLCLAFYSDPIWAWAFPDPERRMAQYRLWWALFVHSGLPRNWIWMSADRGAAALWVPPNQPELNEEDEARVEPLVRELLGAHADDVFTLLDRFDANHPRHTPHYYLSLLGTHPDHRGHGKGMALLRENLERIDEEGFPVYLESSNPVNHHRYERLGFVQVGEFSAPGGGPTAACMWRERQAA